ncbi:AraC family transcriptional regulator [Chryseolinea lacunae]|uniref:Helix-turn-helix domain-containing protein n=1 Tax=Chryseolinea lacunae TaxID=2801331 RepID=A0ABS1L2P7_9BACT|nr:AraC family transcriptional regulator [Chryseolinea lacunae]MBL0745782.1 helix-turn-helix domain-containing protein [Chryseolinea lacunae]
MNKYVLKDTAGPQSSFMIKRQHVPYFYHEMHYHPQLELSLVVRGKGMRYVSNKIEPFQDGDLVLLGANVPHLWKSDQQYFDKPQSDACESITAYFSYNFLGDDFFNKPELRQIRELLLKASAGVKITGKLHNEVSWAMERMEQESQTKRLFILLDVLQKISESQDMRPLTESAITATAFSSSNDRLEQVHQYIFENFRNPITLDEVAHAASMSPTAFCRYFRQRTTKTFSHFLSEVRIGYACQLLQEKRNKIAQVCYESGFANLSTFNKQFKAAMHMTPIQYVRSNV